MHRCPDCSATFFFQFRLAGHREACPARREWEPSPCGRCGRLPTSPGDERTHAASCRGARATEEDEEARKARRRRGLEQYRREQAELQRARAEEEARTRAATEARREEAARRQRPLDGLVLGALGPDGARVLTLTLDLSEPYPWPVGLALDGTPLEIAEGEISLRVAEDMGKVLRGENLNIGKPDTGDRVRIDLARGELRFDLSCRLAMNIPGEDIWHSVTLRVEPERGVVRISEYYDASH